MRDQTHPNAIYRGAAAVVLVVLLAVLAAAPPSFAGSSIGGYTFAPNAAADTATLVAGSQPSFYLCGQTPDTGAPTLPGLTPAESAAKVITDGVADAELLGQTVVDVGFTDNMVVNGPGPDLVVFESGAPEALAVSVFDATTQAFSAPQTYLPASTGTTGGCGFQLNAAAVDLSDFGVLDDNARALFRIDNLGAPGCCGGADLMDVFALDSGEPAPQPLTVPGDVLQPNAGADGATLVAGSDPSFFDCGVTPELGVPTFAGLTPDESATRVVADGSADTEVFGNAVLDVGFTDNVVVNRPGPDLAVFEAGRAEGFTVSVYDAAAGSFSAPQYFDPTELGLYDGCGFPVNAALIELDAFGIPAFGTVSLVRIDNLGQAGGFVGADISDVRAVQSAIPAPFAVKPGSATPTPINLRGGGSLPAALYSTSVFDATRVDTTTVSLFDPTLGNGVRPVSARPVDLNGDGRVDLQLQFSLRGLVAAKAIDRSTGRLVVTAQTTLGLLVLGGTTVRIVP